MSEYCPNCGNGDLLINEYGVQHCRTCLWSSETPNERHVGMVNGLTSSQGYWAQLELLFPQGEHRLRQIRKELGDIQINESPGLITITYRPGGGVHRFPLPLGVESVTGEKLKEVKRGGTYPYAIGDVAASASGMPYPLKVYFSQS